jgi:hypothetical protein
LATAGRWGKVGQAQCQDLAQAPAEHLPLAQTQPPGGIRARKADLVVTQVAAQQYPVGLDGADPLEPLLFAGGPGAVVGFIGHWGLICRVENFILSTYMGKNPHMIRIGEVAKAFGVLSETVRRWEISGKI